VRLDGDRAEPRTLRILYAAGRLTRPWRGRLAL